ncbi:MAG: L-threonylcarbamoyladenylate synthase [Saprospiraceae bacterium]
MSLLEEGKIICYPTDTIWGIGCDATRADAVARVAELRGAPQPNGYVTIVSDIHMLRQYVTDIHPRLETLLAYHTRPLTIVYPTARGLAPNVKALDGSAAIRIVQDDFCKALINSLGRPLLSAAARMMNEDYPTHFSAINKQLLEGVDYVARNRRDDTRHSIPSSIAYLDRHLELEFLRE